MEDHILSKFLTEGDKLDVRPVVPKGSDELPKEYASKLQEIISDDTVDILMPTDQNRTVLFQVNEKYELIFYNKAGLYQCVARVINRYKVNNMMMLRMEFISNLRKYQRRDFYRLGCAFEMRCRALEEEELKALEEKREVEFIAGLPLTQSIVVDISGGGLRFISRQLYAPDSLLYCTYQLLFSNKTKKVEVIGKVLSSGKLDNRPGMYEHRVQYHNIEEKVREEIIRFIFEEERRSRKVD